MASQHDNAANTSDRDRNPDAITGAPGSHPVGTGVGAAGGGAAGAAIGAAVSGPAAPIGAVIGAVVGAVAGGLAGKGAAEAVNPTHEDDYWRENYSSRPYVEPGHTYDDDYRPAYQYGWSSRAEHSDRKFEEVENNMQSGWETTKGKSRLGWDKAKHAARDAWDRVGSGTGASSSSGSDTGRDYNTATTGSSGTVGAPQAYPGHTDERGEMPSAVSTTGRMSGSDLSSGFGAVATAGMDDRTGGLMGTKIGGDTDVDNFTNNSRTRYTGRNFDDVESDLRRDWDSNNRGSGESTWDKVKDSVRSGWHKVERAMPGDADRDNR